MASISRGQFPITYSTNYLYPQLSALSMQPTAAPGAEVSLQLWAPCPLPSHCLLYSHTQCLHKIFVWPCGEPCCCSHLGETRPFFPADFPAWMCNACAGTMHGQPGGRSKELQCGGSTTTEPAHAAQNATKAQVRPFHSSGCWFFLTKTQHCSVSP